MAKEQDLGVVLGHLDDMYHHSNGAQRMDLAAINALGQSPKARKDPIAVPVPSIAMASPREPFVLFESKNTSPRFRHTPPSVASDPEKRPILTRHMSPPKFVEPPHLSAITIELDASLNQPRKQSAQRSTAGINTPKTGSPASHRASAQKTSSPLNGATLGPTVSATRNWSTAHWTLQSRARDEALDGIFQEITRVDSKPLRHVSPKNVPKRHPEPQKSVKSPRQFFQKPQFASAMVMIQAMAAQQSTSDPATLAAENIQSVAVLLKHNYAALGTTACQSIFQGLFRSIYQMNDDGHDVMQAYLNWIADVASDSLPSLRSLKSITSHAEKLEIAADFSHSQSKSISEMQKSCDEKEDKLRELALELENSKQKQADAELNLLEATSRANALMVSGDMSAGFVSNLLYQDALSSVAQLRQDLRDAKTLLLSQESEFNKKAQAAESFMKMNESQKEGLQAMHQQLDDLQMAIMSRDLQIQKLQQEYLDEYSRNPINPCNPVDLIMNSSTWVSKLVRSEDVFDFCSRTSGQQAENNLSQRDQCLGLLLSWINKHLESAGVNIYVSNLGRDLSSGVVFVELFRRCMGNTPYYLRKCDAASVEVDTDSRLKHVAEMASTLLNSPISVSSIMIADAKTMWMIVSELFNTNPTLDPCSIANLKVLSAEPIHVIRRQSLGIILSNSLETTSDSSLFSSLKECLRDSTKTTRKLAEFSHENMYAHMNPNAVVAALNGMTPRWAIHKLPILNLLDSMSKTGGNGCLALCLSIFHKHRAQLCDVFRYYSLLGRESATSLPSMDIDEIGIFLNDAQIDLNPGVAEKLLEIACKECYPETDFTEDDLALDLTSFLVFLLRLVLEPGTKFQCNDEVSDYIVATSLMRLVQNQVCSHANRLVIHILQSHIEFCFFLTLLDFF